MKEKYNETSFTHWEAVTIYELVKNEYCEIADALKSSPDAKKTMKDYNRLMDKLETAIVKTTSHDEG